MTTSRTDNLSDVVGEVVDPFGGDHRREVHTLLPDPVPVPVTVPIVSADDHLVEPGDLFLRRLPRPLAEDAPRVFESDGVEYWRFEDEIEPNRTVQTSAVDRPRDEWTREPVRFDEMRPGSYDPAARLADMDLAGIVGSLCFPSAMFGFAGQRFYRMKDAELGLACMRAYNDWIAEEWVRAAPPSVSSPSRSPGFPTPRSPRTRSGATRRVAFGLLPFLRTPGARLPLAAHPPLGPVSRGMRGDGHGRRPAHRFVVPGGPTVVGLARRRLRGPVPAERDAGQCRLGVLPDPGQIPRPSPRPLGGWAQLGSDDPRTVTAQRKDARRLVDLAGRRRDA